jgi:hypothetical protein
LDLQFVAPGLGAARLQIGLHTLGPGVGVPAPGVADEDPQTLQFDAACVWMHAMPPHSDVAAAF